MNFSDSSSASDVRPAAITAWADRPFNVILWATLIGALPRLYSLSGRTFPQNDGGLWYVLARALVENNLVLPLTVTFNGESFPFAYPPLAAYLLAFLHWLSGYSIIELLVWTPFAVNMLSIPLFGIFCYLFFEDKRKACLATLLYPLVINSYRWFIMGGGVSRSLGLCFLLASWCFFLMWTARQRPCLLILAGLMLGLTGISHPSAVLWAVLGLISFSGAFSPGRALKAFAVIGAVAAACTSPWWVLMLSRHGVQPYVASFSQGEQSLYMPWRFISFDAYFGPLQWVSFFCLLGVASFLARGQRAVPALVLFVILFDPRGAINGNSALLVALAGAEGIILTASALSRLAHEHFRVRAAWASGVLAVLIICNLIQTNLAWINSERSFSYYPTSADLKSIEQIKNSIPAPASFLLISVFVRAGDVLGEWLVSLATGYRSVAMHQAAEWRGDFVPKLHLQWAIEDCCWKSSAGCVADYVKQSGLRSDYLLVHKESCPGVAMQLSRLPSGALVLDTPTIVVFNGHVLENFEGAWH